jgi:dihydrofolate reductase
VRKVVVHMQTTLNNRIGKADGTFWEPFPWGEQEQAFLNDSFRQADTWMFGRRVYEAVVPWWDTVAAGEIAADVPAVSDVDREFAQILKGLRKVVISSTLEPDEGREVTSDPVAILRQLKEREGRDIIFSGGPQTLATVSDLVDEYLVVVHPAVVADGPGLFDGQELALTLSEAKVFDCGCVLLRYAVAK